MRAASWPDRVNALGCGHYRRFDERTATMLGQAAELLIDRWRRDLRALHAQAQGAVPGFPAHGIPWRRAGRREHLPA